MTRWASLHMLSLCSLLFLHSHHSPPSAAAAGRGCRCLTEVQLKNKVARFEKKYWNTGVPKNLQDASECAQAVKNGEVNERSLSPWKYNITREDDRFPQEIAIAECLCSGCIINKHEDKSYNSVPVIAKLMVLRKTPCPSSTGKYVLKKYFVKIAVGCTCVVPKSLK